MRSAPANSHRTDALDPAGPLSDADALASDGRWREAIDVLTAANRQGGNALIEQRLVGLRHAAFAHLDRSQGREQWPPVVDDLFSARGRAPEVPVADLTSDTLGAGVLRHGCLLVRNLVPAQRVGALVDAIDRAIAAHDARRDGAPASETAPWFVPFKPGPGYKVGYGRQWVRDGGGVWTVDSPRAMFEVLETFEQVGLDRVIAGYLGERPALSVKKWTLRRVPIDTSADWHQDGAFLGSGIRTINVWLSLSQCGEDAPGLDIVPRRLDHIVETGSHGAQFDWSVGPELVERVAGDAGVMRPTFEPGDALLFDDFFLHQTGVSPGMTQDRYAIESWFFAPSTYPHDQVPIVF
jgi:hypothetical protein